MAYIDGNKVLCTTHLHMNDEAGYEAGYEEGREAAKSEFWESFQHGGKRTNYTNAFYGWKEDCFTPKYNLAPTTAAYMFSFFSALYTSKETSLKRLLKNAGVVLDFSKCTNFANMLNYSEITEIGEINTANATSLEAMFRYAKKLKTCEKLILGTKTITSYNDMFYPCTALENITIEGNFNGSISLQWSPLTKASITSVINALNKNVNGKNLTLNLASVNTAFETSAGAADGSKSTEFAALVATKPTWTISLV